MRALCVVMARTEHFSGARRILLWKTCAAVSIILMRDIFGIWHMIFLCLDFEADTHSEEL